MLANGIIRNGTLFDHVTKQALVKDLIIENGIITDICTPTSSRVITDFDIDASGKWILPGLIDCFVNQVEPKIFLDNGVIAACIPVNHTTVSRDDSNLMTLQHLLPLTKDLKSQELSELSLAKHAAFAGVSNGVETIKNTELLLRCYHYAATFDLTVFIQPNEPYLGKQGCMHEGLVSTKLGLPGIPAAAEAIDLARHLFLIEHTGVRAHFNKLSSKQAVSQIRQAKAQGLLVTADVAICNLLLTDEHIGRFDANCHTVPPLRTAKDKLALQAGIFDGTIDAICSDHTPLRLTEKLTPFAKATPGISSVDTLLPLALSIAKHEPSKVNRIIEALSIAPAKILGLQKTHGLIKKNQTANIIIYDPNLDWQVNQTTITSFGKNTPYIGSTLKGKITDTIIYGQWSNSIKSKMAQSSTDIVA